MSHCEPLDLDAIANQYDGQDEAVLEQWRWLAEHYEKQARFDLVGAYVMLAAQRTTVLALVARCRFGETCADALAEALAAIRAIATTGLDECDHEVDQDRYAQIVAIVDGNVSTPKEPTDA